MTSKVSQAHSKNIHFTDKGSGSCIVFLHGFLESLEIWDDYSDKLSEKFRVVCIDLPGHGKSGNIGNEHSIELMADCVRVVLDELKIKKCVLIGHSMGGYVALAFAENNPEYLSGFCLFHSHSFPDSDERKKDRKMAIRVIKHNPALLINEMIPNLFAPENFKKFGKQAEKIRQAALAMTQKGTINSIWGMVKRKDRSHILKNSPCPVLYILGEQDPVMDFEVMKPLLKLSDKIQPLVIENCGHMGFIEAKEKCLNEIDGFSKKCFK
ncbi:MAG: alpha/beta hydrolase [Flavobacteriales bacterium]|nr:MAG: alpha/beta hydrolase [Flavobacteriales bacterium]